MKLRSTLLTKLVAWCAVALLRCLFRTVRREIVFPNNDRDLDAYDPNGRGRYLYCTWHDSILQPLFFGRHHHSAGVVSRHQDGSYLAEAMKLIRVEPIRGSSHRGGVQALKESLSAIENFHVTITPDGPRGPRRQLKDGIIYLASKSGHPIVPIACEFESCWRIKGSWTDLIVPKPFSRVRMILGEPIHVPNGLSREQIKEFTELVQNRMDVIYTQAEQRKAG